LTLTFDNDVANGERERRYNSLAVNVLRPKYGAAIVVAEFHHNGLLHYHALVAMTKENPHRAVDWASQARYWKTVARRYGCGRVEFAPVRDGAAYGRYLLKDLAQPTPNAVRVRRIRYVGAMRREWVDKQTGEIKKGSLPEFCRPYSESFAWANGRASEWRRKAADFAKKMHAAGVIDAPTPAALEAKLGRSWFLLCQEDIEQGRLHMSYADWRALSAAARRARGRLATPPREAALTEGAVSKSNREVLEWHSSQSDSRNSRHAQGRNTPAALAAVGCSNRNEVKFITHTRESKAAMLWDAG
jgi:hypothetical protein